MNREEIKEVIKKQIEGAEERLEHYEKKTDCWQKRHAELQAQLKALDKVWKPEVGEVCWYLSAGGTAFSEIWENSPLDNNAYVMGNYYRTEDEAIFAREKQKVVTELQRYADEHNEGEFDWHDFGQRKHFFDYNFRDKCLDFDCIYWYKSANETYFTSEKIAREAVQAVGEDRVKKYLFGVGK